EVEASIDRVVHYAGWSDKIASLLSSTNPVAGPHFNVTSPEPTGVVAIATPEVEDCLLAMVSTVLPVIVSGNGTVVIGPERDRRRTIIFCECLATSDLPAGVVNMLTGLRSEVLPHLAKHMDVHALDVWTGGTVSDEMAKAAAGDATDNVKRVRVRSGE